MKDPLQRIQELQRSLRSSSDSKTRAELLILRSRVEGEKVYLEALQDRLLWNLYPASIQDQAIQAAGKLLGASYRYSQTKIYECSGLAHRIATFEHINTGAMLNLIPGGTYQMGSADLDTELSYCQQFYSGWSRGWIKWETPQHTVTIPPMLVGRYLVRQSIWDKIGGQDNRQTTGKDLPIANISWENCQSWLTKAGASLRMLSEAEWEYACRAGSLSRYYWSTSDSEDNIDPSYCWFEANSNGQTHHVESHETKTNAFGLVDCLGHLWEWCHDDWHGDYETGPNDHQPRISKGAYEHVLRGGAYCDNPGYCRTAHRLSIGSDNYDVGFRLARSLET